MLINKEKNLSQINNVSQEIEHISLNVLIEEFFTGFIRTPVTFTYSREMVEQE